MVFFHKRMTIFLFIYLFINITRTSILILLIFIFGYVYINKKKTHLNKWRWLLISTDNKQISNLGSYKRISPYKRDLKMVYSILQHKLNFKLPKVHNHWTAESLGSMYYQRYHTTAVLAQHNWQIQHIVKTCT